MDKGKRELTLTEENLKLDEMIAHRDFLIQLVVEQDKRIQKMKRELEDQGIDKMDVATQKLVKTPGLMEFLDKQNRSATTIISTGG